MNDWFEKGAKAFHAGTPRSACPYKAAGMRGSWLAGWDAAQAGN